MRYHFQIHKEKKGGYFAQCIEIEGCMTQAETLHELKENMREVLNLSISEPEGSKFLVPRPNDRIKASKDIEVISPDPQVALAYSVRYFRLKHNLSQKEAAKKMGYADIFSYQRLESSKCNPTLKTLSKIKEIFPEFSLDRAIG